jgi:hypothetical protein
MTAQASVPSPTLQETLDWVKRELADHRDTRWADGPQLTAIDGCRLTFSDNHGSHPSFAVSLGDLDPNSVKGFTQTLDGAPWRYPVSFRTWSNKPLVFFFFDESYKTGSSLLLQDEGEAKRTASALKHAVELCGGKPSLF